MYCFPKCFQQLQLGQAETWSPELNVGLPSQWQGPKHLSHHLLPPRVYSNRELNWEDSNPGTLIWDTMSQLARPEAHFQTLQILFFIKISGPTSFKLPFKKFKYS